MLGDGRDEVVGGCLKGIFEMCGSVREVIL